jgi:hypothetical protein
MRALLLCLACGCGSAPATPPSVPVAPQPGPPPSALAEPPISDPAEYAIARVSRDAGEAIFTRTGIGDPYRTGVPYPIFIALMREYPRILGRDTQELAHRFGFVARAPDPASDDPDVRAGLPIGMHLTTDPITNVQFVVTSCALCHAERIRWPGGEALVIGLANKRVRIHAYDAAFAAIAQAPGFTAPHVARLAAEAARAAHTPWPDAYGDAIAAATVRALDACAVARRELHERTRDGLPGRVATIESFVGPLAQLAHTGVDYAPDVGWAKVPDVIGVAHRVTLSWDASGQGSIDLLAVEADVAAGVRVAWLEGHPFQGPSLGAYLRTPAPRPPFPGPIDRRLAARGKQLFEDNCAHCHGRYDAAGRVLEYEEQVVPLSDLGTDPARAMAPTESFERAANDRAVTRGYTSFKRTGGYVPPVLTNVWARAPYGHVGQWPSLAVMALPPASRPHQYDVDPDAAYDLGTVGIALAAHPSDRTYHYDASRPGLSVAGHPFLADLGGDARAVIEYLKTL